MALTGVATYLVAIYLIPLGLPTFGAVVRDFAADLATYNAPARIMIWLAGGGNMQRRTRPCRRARCLAPRYQHPLRTAPSPGRTEGLHCLGSALFLENGGLL